MVIHLRIADGSPSSEEVYESMVVLVKDESSAWYQGKETGLTDPGVVPTNNEEQSSDDKYDGRLPMGLIFPVGFAPLGLMFAMYLMMTGAAKRKQVEGERTEGGSKFKEEPVEGGEENLEGKEPAVEGQAQAGNIDQRTNKHD